MQRLRSQDEQLYGLDDCVGKKKFCDYLESFNRRILTQFRQIRQISKIKIELKTFRARRTLADDNFRVVVNRKVLRSIPTLGVCFVFHILQSFTNLFWNSKQVRETHNLNDKKSFSFISCCIILSTITFTRLCPLCSIKVLDDFTKPFNPRF